LLDGTPAPLEGGIAPKNTMIAEKEEASSKISGTETIDGKPALQWEDTLSKDGKSFARTNWYPNHPDEKQTIVFEKQQSKRAQAGGVGAAPFVFAPGRAVLAG